MNSKIIGHTGNIQITTCPITGYKYSFQPFYRKLTRSEKRKLKTE
jgi:hypothetical protein